MYSLVRKFFFKIEPEKAHYMVMRYLRLICRLPILKSIVKSLFCLKSNKLQRTIWGITFPNPVGLAAGFDKDAAYTDALACLGFGFIEIGTVTPVAQPGNEQPRLFRLPEDKALINRMGFNNHGVLNAVANLRKRKEKVIIGGNIGKNKVTANEDAYLDYEKCFKELYEVVDYFVVNVSSPNTPGLRELQDKEPLMKILNNLERLNKDMGKHKPILLKIAPDLSNEQLDDIIIIVKSTGIGGLVATNTTIDRSGLITARDVVGQIGAGGLSGKPLQNRAVEVVKYIHENSHGAFPIIAVGGIFTGADAKAMLAAGASLVQVYTGFIYQGPGIARDICREILN